MRGPVFRFAAALAVLLVAALVVGQIVLPGVAEDRLREDLASSGAVERVHVRAFPALKLLFDRADRVEVRMGEVQAQPRRFADLLASTHATGKLDARAATMRVGPLRVRDLRLGKDEERLEGEAAVTSTDLAAALPPSVGLRPVASENGALVLEATAGILGAGVVVRARLSARDGALVIAPDGLLGGLAALTVFSDPRVRVTSVGARERADGFTLTAAARLVG